MVGLNRRRYSVVERAIEDAGGRDQITAVFVEWSEDPWYLRDSRKFTPAQIANWIYGNSLHGLDLLTFLAGDVPQPAVHARNFGDPCRWMMALQGISERGVLASFHSTWDSPSRWRLVFCTPHRRYTFAPLESCQVTERDQKESRTIEPDDFDARFKPGFHGQARDFLAMIASRRASPLQSLSAAAPAMKLADRLTDACLAQQSAR
jgi:predicted dehydrogenase